MIQVFVLPYLPSWLPQKTYGMSKSHTASGRLFPATWSSPLMLCSFSAISGGNATELHFSVHKILWLELWQLWSQSTQIYFFKRTQQVPKYKSTHNVKHVGQFVPHATRAGLIMLALGCTCRYQNEPHVASGHTISTEATCAVYK